MTLFRRGNVYWAYVYLDGVRHAKSTGTGNRRLAETVEQKFKEELNLRRQGITQHAPEMPIAELAARFLSDGDPRPYHVDRLRVLLPFWGERRIGQITKPMAREYRRVRHAEKQISEATVNRDLEALRHMLFWAVDEGFLAANPLSRVPMVRVRRKPRFVMSVEEEEKLLAAAAPHLKRIVIAALDTGMRRGEILAQRWEHIDFTREILYVTHSKTVEGEAREIPLTGRLHDLLLTERQTDGLIFTFKGQPIRRIKTAWKASIRRAGIRYYRFHDLRHCFNTRLLEAGVMQEVRKALMGHSSGEDVHAIYTHVELPAKRTAIGQLEAWLKAQRRNLETNTHSRGETETTERERADLHDRQGLQTAGRAGREEAR